MYYCNKCGAIFFVNRPENLEKETGPSFTTVCEACNGEVTFRRLVPEDFGAANVKELDSSVKYLKGVIREIKSNLPEEEEEDNDETEEIAEE